MVLLVLYGRSSVAAPSREEHLCAARGAATEDRPYRFLAKSLFQATSAGMLALVSSPFVVPTIAF